VSPVERRGGIGKKNLPLHSMCIASIPQPVDVFAVAVISEVVVTMVVCIVAFVILLIPIVMVDKAVTVSMQKEEEEERKTEIGSNARYAFFLFSVRFSPEFFFSRHRIFLIPNGISFSYRSLGPRATNSKINK
jgi:hypothetical protein